MSIISQAIEDLQFIMENDNDFGTPVTFAKRDGSETVTVNCLTNKVMLDVESNNVVSVTERTTVAVHETTLTAAGYTVRNGSNQVSMIGDLVTLSVFGGEKEYTIKYQIPDQKFGCLVFVLERYAQS